MKKKNSNLKLLKKDYNLLRCITAFRILTVSQIAALNQRSRQVIRRRLRELRKKGLVSIQHQICTDKTGRPENIVLLTLRGYDLAKKNDRIGKMNILENKAIDSYCINHDLLVNWVIIALLQMKRQLLNVQLYFLTPYYSSIEKGSPNSSLIKIQLFGNSYTPDFIPDCVFVLSDSESHKALLFFIEVDMGTETRISRKRETKDVRQKIINYQELFKSSQYKLFEKHFNFSLNGFRLLFITNTNSRLKSICQLVSVMPPSDFIWLTDQDAIFSSGISDQIWFKGGKREKGLESILGERMASECKILIPK